MASRTGRAPSAFMFTLNVYIIKYFEFAIPFTWELKAPAGGKLERYALMLTI